MDCSLRAGHALVRGKVAAGRVLNLKHDNVAGTANHRSVLAIVGDAERGVPAANWGCDDVPFATLGGRDVGNPVARCNKDVRFAADGAVPEGFRHPKSLGLYNQLPRGCKK